MYSGKLNVPWVRNADLPSSLRSYDLPDNGVFLKTCDSKEDKNFAKDFMLNNFYRSAPVPNALRLFNVAENLGPNSIVHQEFGKQQS